MARWAIGLEINGARIDAEGLARLVETVGRESPDFGAECALWSGVLSVHGTVEAATPNIALEHALTRISAAFDHADVDAERLSEITSVSIRRTRGEASTPEEDSLSGALLRLVPRFERR